MSETEGASIQVGWLLAAAGEVPADDGWLGAAESRYLSALHQPWRRADWRLGRWTARQAIAACLGAVAGSIEIRPAADGAPEALFDGLPAPVVISLSHRAGRAACAVAPAGAALGCDLEVIEPRSAPFISDFFTAAEKERVDRADPAERPLLANLTWSAKESVLKALRTGLRADTRSVQICFEAGSGAEWSSFVAALVDSDRTFHGWWRRLEDLVITLAADPEPRVPRRLLAPLTPARRCSSAGPSPSAPWARR